MTDLLHDPYAMYYVFAALVAVPVWRIFKRLHKNPLWTMLLSLPMIGLAACGAAMIFPRRKGQTP